MILALSCFVALWIVDVVLNFYPYASRTEKVSPTFDRASGEDLAFDGSTVLSDFLVR
jgi:hypothetical protein